MRENTYKLIELVGTSEKTMEDAISGAIERASLTLKALDWFEVTEARGTIQDGKVALYQVTMKVGFRLMKDEDL